MQASDTCQLFIGLNAKPADIVQRSKNLIPIACLSTVFRDRRCGFLSLEYGDGEGTLKGPYSFALGSLLQYRKCPWLHQKSNAGS